MSFLTAKKLFYQDKSNVIVLLAIPVAVNRSQTRRSKEHVPSKEKPESERVEGEGDNLGTPVKAPPPPALLTKPVMISLTPQRKASLDKDDKITPR